MMLRSFLVRRCDGSQEVLEEPTSANDRRCGHPLRVPNMNAPQWQCDTKGSVCAIDINSSGAALVTVSLCHCAQIGALVRLSCFRRLHHTH